MKSQTCFSLDDQHVDQPYPEKKNKNKLEDFS
jgi:hypothetical protein